MLKDTGQVFSSYLLPHSRLSASGRCIGYRGSDYLPKLRPMLALNIVLMLACVYFNFASTRRSSSSSPISSSRRIGRAMTLIFTMALALEALALLSPLFNQWVADEALASNDRGLLKALTIGFALLIVIQTGISIARSWSVVFLATHLNLHGCRTSSPTGCACP